MDFDPWAQSEADEVATETEAQYFAAEEIDTVEFATPALIQVKEIPQKEGLLFKHTNYQVIHADSKVVRRYSDFAWLVEFLLKKYTFRIIPQLPPKKFGTSNNDTLFLQRRRRGLQRFLYQLCKHPLLSKENLVQMFLTVPDDFSNWRKYAKIDWDNEFDMMKLPPLPPKYRINLDVVLRGLGASLNAEVDEPIDHESNTYEQHEQQRISNEAIIKCLKQIWKENPLDPNEMDFIANINVINQSLNEVASLWSKMFTLVERIEKRELALIIDQLKFSGLITEMIKSDVGIYGMNTIGGNVEEEQNLGIINQTLKQIQSYFQVSKRNKTDEMINITTSVLENWKSLQDYLTSFHFLIERINEYRLESDREIHFLLNDINKLIERFVQMKARLDFKPINADKLILNLNENIQKLNKLLNRILIVKESFISEYKLFQGTKYIMSQVLSDWCKERAHLMDKNNDGIQRLLDVLDDLPK